MMTSCERGPWSRWVGEQLGRMQGPVGTTEHLADLALSPDGLLAAVTTMVRPGPAADPVPEVRLVDLAAGVFSGWRSGFAAARPAWSPSADRLALIRMDLSRPTLRLTTGTGAGGEDVDLPGSVEALAWSPDGRSLLALVADDGAELSDVDGSGRRPGGADAMVRAAGASGWRRAWLVDTVTGATSVASADGVNVWEAAWAGPDEIAVIASDHPSEGAWYDSRLLVGEPGADRSQLREIALVDGQRACLRGAPDGSVAIVVGPMSDRGIDAGCLVVVDAQRGTATAVDVDGDVTDVQWEAEGTLVVASVHGLATLVTRIDPRSGASHVLARGEDWTIAGVAPRLASGAGRVAAVTCGPAEPEAISLIAEGGRHRRFCAVGEVTAGEVAAGGRATAGGTVTAVSWSSTDGVVVDGLVARPAGSPTAGPWPLVVHVHGGPVWAWRPQWQLGYPYTPLLTELGCVVLHPNGRGSIGRGAEFVDGGLHDMGGQDIDDIVAGIGHLVETGVADPDRVAVIGNSYGGFAAAWMSVSTGLLRAAVARSPVTDWVSQHFTSNIAAFDVLALGADPLDPDSAYRTRSPLYRAGAIANPILLIAGAHDLATPPAQAEMFHRAVLEAGGSSDLVIYEDEGHGVRGRPAIVDHLGRIAAFLAAHLDLEQPVGRPVSP